jgi:hypothetical protein
LDELEAVGIVTELVLSDADGDKGETTEEEVHGIIIDSKDCIHFARSSALGARNSFFFFEYTTKKIRCDESKSFLCIPKIQPVGSSAFGDGDSMESKHNHCIGVKKKYCFFHPPVRLYLFLCDIHSFRNI